jgi:hypothetical protein
MRALGIRTAWRDHPDRIADHERPMGGAQVIVVDDSSTPELAQLLREMVDRLGRV